MTTKTMMICAAAALWCAATALKAVVALIHRESYVISWWDAAVAGTGRTLGRGRTAIKLVMMIVVAATCVLPIARVIAPTQVFYVVVPVLFVTAIVEMSAPKPQRRGR